MDAYQGHGGAQHRATGCVGLVNAERLVLWEELHSIGMNGIAQEGDGQSKGIAVRRARQGGGQAEGHTVEGMAGGTIGQPRSIGLPSHSVLASSQNRQGNIA